MRYQKLTLVFLTVFLFLTLTSHAYATITVPTNVYFGLPNYHTYINFDTSETFTTIQRENNYWRFNNYKFQVQNGNLTITKFFTDNQLIFNVTAPSATTTTTRIYCGNQGKPATVTGATSWSYNDLTNILTVNILHSSPQQIIVEWVGTPEFRAVLRYLRGNYYLVFLLLSVVPMVYAVSIILKMIKAKDSLKLQDIYAMVAIAITIIIGYIVIWNIMNAIIGG